MNTRKFDAGDVIYRLGEEALSAFEVREGRVRLAWHGPSGLQQTAVIGAGQIFGETELLAGNARTATAEAASNLVVHELGREDFARLLAEDADIGKSLLRPVFERVRRDAQAATRPTPSVAPHATPVPVLSELRLEPGGREIARQMEASGVRIATLPFRVGRRSLRGAFVDEGPVELTLEDQQPYSLSRRHFAIEARGVGFVVRDCGSHHGTIVNGVRIGGTLPVSVAALKIGENRIVAGRAASPFQFVLTIGGN